MGKYETGMTYTKTLSAKQILLKRSHIPRFIVSFLVLPKYQMLGDEQFVFSSRIAC